MTSKAINCVRCQCPRWFQSFCTLYDIWSALIGASVQNYRDMIVKGYGADGTLKELIIKFIQEMEDCDSIDDSGRFAAICETFFALNPFPQCFESSCSFCSCFDTRPQHQYQEVSSMTPLICSRVNVNSAAVSWRLAIV